MFLASLLLIASQPADAPKAVVLKAIKAANLPDPAVLPVHAFKEEGTITLGGTKAPYTSTWTVRFPDAFRFDLTTELMGEKFGMTLVVNGKKGYESGAGRPEDLAGEKLQYSLNELYQLRVASLVPLTTDGEFKLGPAAEADIGGKKAVGVKIDRRDREPIALYFDAETGLLVKSATRVADEFQKWKMVPEEVTYGDYKDFAGRKVYTTIAVVRDGKTLLESKLSGHEFLKSADAKLFEKK